MDGIFQRPYFYVNKFDLFSQALSEQLCDATQKSAFTEANRHSSYNPKLPSGKSYNAKGGWYIYYLVSYIKFKLNSKYTGTSIIYFFNLGYRPIPGYSKVLWVIKFHGS